MRADQLTQRNMLIKLYLLITAWTCVSGVIVVTQNPPVLTLSKGQTATLDCNLDTITDRGARCDLPCTMSLVELKWLFRMDDIIRTAPQSITTLEISARSGQGLQDVLSWLFSNRSHDT
ncbi:ADP-ribosylation factor 16 [Labeo rohita]|uniref:ADP-ribosylation factor 16 n=1 Tax=Labeo rohita TaxID=84645 RepID=A0A498NG91_LABRO|nr:ADP-ribosylation factor 16 [Labeo rohita]